MRGWIDRLFGRNRPVVPMEELRRARAASELAHKSLVCKATDTTMKAEEMTSSVRLVIEDLLAQQEARDAQRH